MELCKIQIDARHMDAIDKGVLRAFVKGLERDEPLRTQPEESE